MAYDQGVSI